MKPLGGERRHYWLALGMARATGADLQEALESGRITHGDWAAVVTACRGCAWADGCDCWMRAQDPDGASAVPRACPNADFFERVLAGAAQSEETVASSHQSAASGVVPACSHVTTGRS
mgnify:CR=1 FL=1